MSFQTLVGAWWVGPIMVSVVRTRSCPVGRNPKLTGRVTLVVSLFWMGLDLSCPPAIYADKQNHVATNLS